MHEIQRKGSTISISSDAIEERVKETIEGKAILRSIDGEKVFVIPVEVLLGCIWGACSQGVWDFEEDCDSEVVIDMMADMDISDISSITESCLFRISESQNAGEQLLTIGDSLGCVMDLTGDLIVKSTFNKQSPYDVERLRKMIRDAGFGDLLKDAG